MARNPAWDTDELLLALDVYFRFPEARKSKSHPEVAKLSAALRSLPLPVKRPDPVRFRNTNGVAMKLANIAALDPEYTADGHVGLKAGGRLEQTLWDRYVDRQDELHELAESIRASAVAGTLPTQKEEGEDGEDGALEGRFVWRWHRQRERAPGKVAEKKEKMRATLGELYCEVCGMTEAHAALRFGTLTSDIYECHHTKPLHTLTGTTRTRLIDLAVVCPSCHRALHRIEPPISVSELRLRVQKSTTHT